MMEYKKWFNNIVNSTKYLGTDLAKEAWNHQQQKITTLEGREKKLVEFVTDCSNSHNETRYLYRAKVLLKELNKPETINKP